MILLQRRRRRRRQRRLQNTTYADSIYILGECTWIDVQMLLGACETDTIAGQHRIRSRRLYGIPPETDRLARNKDERATAFYHAIAVNIAYWQGTTTMTMIIMIIIMITDDRDYIESMFLREFVPLFNCYNIIFAVFIFLIASIFPLTFSLLVV